MLLTSGLLVTQNVRLLRPLGEGGMGTVWVGEHLGLETQVAVKFISPELSHQDPEIFARFQREARIAARIRSQHVVQVFDHGVMDDDTPFIVMELLQGSSLGEWLDLTGTLPLADTVQVVSQVAGVLGKAHELDIVHRDIKPANIFLVDSEDAIFVKVLDFGIAKDTKVASGSMRTGTGVLVGTPDFMSPEQLLRAGPVDHRADLWALAVVAYRATTGQCPFSGETLAGIIVAITEGAFRPASVIAPRPVPAALDGWFARALARDPAKRFGSARELAESLQRAASAPTLGRAPAAIAGSDRPTRRPQARAARVAGRAEAPLRRPGGKGLSREPRLELPEPRSLPDEVLRGALVAAETQRSRLPAQGAGQAEAVPLPVAATRGSLPLRDEEQDGDPHRDHAQQQAPRPRRATPPRPARPGEDATLLSTGAPGEPLAEPAAARAAAPVARAPRSQARVARAPNERIAVVEAPRIGSIENVDLAAPVRERPMAPRSAFRPREQDDDLPSSWLGELAPPVLAAAVAMVTAQLVDPRALASLQARLQAGAAAPLLLLGAALGVACWRVSLHAQRLASLLLWLSSLGLGLLAAASVVAAATVVPALQAAASFLPWAEAVAPFAAAAGLLGLGAIGALRAKVELLGPGTRRPLYGVIVLLLSLSSLGLAYRLLQRSSLLRDSLGGASSASASLEATRQAQPDQHRG